MIYTNSKLRYMPLFFEEDKIFLRSFLAEQSFARTDLEKLLAEDGFAAEICADGQILLKKWNG